MALRRYVLGSSSANVEISAAQNDTASSWVLHVTGTIGTGTIAVKGYVNGRPSSNYTASSGLTRDGATSDALTTSDAVALAYYVGSTGTLTAGSTSISALGVYRVIADGCSVYLEYTAAGGSDLVVHAKPIRG